MEKILLCLNHLGGKEIEYVTKAIEDNWIVPLGPDVNAFEKELLEFMLSEFTDTEAREKDSVRRVLALSAGTAAIHLALTGLGVGKDDEVICQSFTFCATANPIVYLGATPVFVDSEPGSWNMSPEMLEKAIEDRIRVRGVKPKAIIVAELYGMPADFKRILPIAQRYGIPVVEDSAEAFGSRYRGVSCGFWGCYGVLSFNGNKMITTSGGGALICADEEARSEMMFYATQAREGYPYYQHEHIGYNYRLSNISAAIGRGQLEIASEHLAWHRKLHALYRELLRDVKGVRVHDNPDADYDSNFWLTTILLEEGVHVRGEERAYCEQPTQAVGGAAGKTHRAASLHTDCEPDAAVEALRLTLLDKNVESRPLWKPLHRQPVFANAPAYVNGVSENLFRRGLCLPSGPYVTEEQVKMICSVIRESLTE